MPFATPPVIANTASAYTAMLPVASEIDTQHPIYAALLNQRIKCRDVVSGQDVIKSKNEVYLPRLSGQTNDAYKMYKLRALFFSIGAKSLQALVGMASLKEPKVKAPVALTEKYFNFDENVTLQENYVKMCHEVLLQNQAGAMVEWPQNGGDAYIIVHPSEAVINWDYDDNGKLILVVIRELHYKKNGKYKRDEVIRHRELYLNNGVYEQTIYDDKILVSTIQPTVKGQPLNFIPFIPFNSKGIGFTDEPPMLLDIANINISHYLTSADLEHGRHFTGLPTPIITGASSDTPLHIGSNEFIVLPDKNANAKYLEFTGQGLQSLEKALQEKQAMLASLSARLLDNSSKGSEATEAVKLRYLSETASLTTVVKTINVVMNMLYNIIATSMSENPKDVSIKFDTDFLSAQMTSAEMTTLFNGYISGAIDLDTLIFNMRSGQRLNPDIEDDAIKLSIEKRAEEIVKANKAAQPKPAETPAQPKNPTSEK